MSEEKKNIDPVFTSSVTDTEVHVFTEQAWQNYKKEEEERREYIHKKIFKIGSIALFLLVMFIFASIAWFTMSRENQTDGMNVKAQEKSFDLITLSDDSTNENGVYYDPYLTAIQKNESESYNLWLVGSDSNISNYSNTGLDDGSFGIEPGSNGVIKFYIKPYQDVTIDFSFETIGYNSRTTMQGGEEQVTMTALSSNAGDPACFLNGHVLLFENYDSVSGFFSGLIPTNSDGKRVLSRSFQFNGSYDADTNNDSYNDAYEVDIYWIWPETLDTLVDNENPSATMICDRTAEPLQGETDNDYTKVVNNICTYPQYYLKGYSTTTTYTEELVRGRNAMYNDADQDIGMNIEYVLLRLDTVDGSDE